MLLDKPVGLVDNNTVKLINFFKRWLPITERLWILSKNA